MIAKFAHVGTAVFYEASVDAAPEVGESVMLCPLGHEDGDTYRILKREWKLSNYRGFQDRIYTNVEVYLYVEEE